MSIHPDDPTSARLELDWHRSYSRDDWQVSTECSITLTSMREAFQVMARLDAHEGESRVFSRNWDEMIPRDLV
jgi:hypothetical protein